MSSDTTASSSATKGTSAMQTFTPQTEQGPPAKTGGLDLSRYPKPTMDATLTKEENLFKYVYAHAKKGDAQSVLDAVDAFCYRDNWMMNVGNRKGQILDNAIAEHKPRAILELGTYCGYSAVRIGRQLPENGRLLSLDIDEAAVKRGNELVAFAGLEKKVTCVLGSLEQNQEVIKTMYGIQDFDLVFLDHWKDAYLQDIQKLEKYKFLRKGSVIVADNVIFPGCPDYLEYVRTCGRYKTTFFEALLEYDVDKKDGMEVSIFTG